MSNRAAVKNMGPGQIPELGELFLPKTLKGNDILTILGPLVFSSGRKFLSKISPKLIYTGYFKGFKNESSFD